MADIRSSGGINKTELSHNDRKRVRDNAGSHQPRIKSAIAAVVKPSNDGRGGRETGDMQDRWTADSPHTSVPRKQDAYLEPGTVQRNK